MSDIFRVGDLFTAEFHLSVEGECSGIGFKMKYDPVGVEFLDHTLNNIFEHENCTLQNDKQGKLVLAFNNKSKAFVTGQQIILEANFKALSEGTFNLEFEGGKAVLSGAEIESEFNNTDISIIVFDRVVMSIVIKKKV